MTEAVQQQVEKALEHSNCNKDCVFVRTGFKNVCRTRDVGSEWYVECLEHYFDCECAIVCGYGYDNVELRLCKCPAMLAMNKVRSGRTGGSKATPAQVNAQ